MKKKLLVVLLTLALVFSFGSIASAVADGDVGVAAAYKSADNPVASIKASAGQTVYVTLTLPAAEQAENATYALKLDGSTVSGTKNDEGDLVWKSSRKVDSAKGDWVVS